MNLCKAHEADPIGLALVLCKCRSSFIIIVTINTDETRDE